MSREVRRVPVDWKHPTAPNPHAVFQREVAGRLGKPVSRMLASGQMFVPLLGKSLKVYQAEWDEGLTQWQAGTHRSFDFSQKYHSRSGFVDRDGEVSFQPIRFYGPDGKTLIEECWAEDVDLREQRFFMLDNDSRPDETWECMPDFDVPEAELGWCLYESVSEGTPVTPVFATADELVEHLCTIGQDWDQEPMRRASAEAIVRRGHTIGSMIVTNGQILRADVDADVIETLSSRS